MNAALLILLGQALDVLLKAVLKQPELAPSISPIVAALIPALSQAAGETPEETAARRETAETVFVRWAKPLGSGA